LFAGSVQILHRVKQKVRLADWPKGLDGSCHKSPARRTSRLSRPLLRVLQDFAPESVKGGGNPYFHAKPTMQGFSTAGKKSVSIPYRSI